MSSSRVLRRPAGGRAVDLRAGAALRPTSLRARATAAFAAVVLVLTGVLVAVVWISVSSYLLLQRERVALAQTEANARQVVRSLAGDVLSPADALAAAAPRDRLDVAAAHRRRPVDDELAADRPRRPARRAAPAGARRSGRPASASRSTAPRCSPSACRCRPTAQAYFEIYSLEELDGTYRVLGIVLAAAALTVVPLSVLVGWRVTRPALKPLDDLAGAAAAIADGDLHTRIDPGDDPSLAPLAASFNRTAEALEQRLRCDARFAADVSHELRSPLTTMLNAAALVDAYRDRLPDDGREGLDLLQTEVRNFERLVSDLLEISRADAGSTDAALETVRLTDLVRATLDRRNRARGAEVPLTVAPRRGAAGARRQAPPGAGAGQPDGQRRRPRRGPDRRDRGP